MSSHSVVAPQTLRPGSITTEREMETLGEEGLLLREKRSENKREGNRGWGSREKLYENIFHPIGVESITVCSNENHQAGLLKSNFKWVNGCSL
ncbi:hypothetical protein CEXT_227281 [Caerostris extrusa]|uniref:Uncharacterized protein n=1 Tax=Caerostris extrusa TaxID=172846 RepID=A0AAV4XKA7_CAEEX|nr:hypothetical protein CEXT_227281 [Caerostris extrusa]